MAAVIKAHTQQRRESGHTSRAAAFDLHDMTARGEQYVQQVRREATKIIQQAHQQAEAIRKRAEVDGRAAAEKAALEVLDAKVAQRMQTVLPALEGAVKQLLDHKALWLRRCEESLVHLAVGIAQRILQRELQQEPEVAEAWIRESLQLAAGAAQVTLQMHPTDVETLGAQVDRIRATISKLSELEVVADDELSPGDCVIATQFGEIDMRIASQLARLSEELLGESK